MQLNGRIKAIDILKGIAMIMVILFHYEQGFGICKWFHYLQTGCPIFFVCSGFGIISLISRKYSSLVEDRNTLFSFYLSRFKSLAPGWYLAFVVVFIINTIMIALTGKTLNFGVNRSPLAIIINLVFLNGLFPFCNNNVMLGGWYIGTTAILYLITPLVLLYLNKSNNRKLFFIVTSIIGMIVWFILLELFGERFLYNGFSYFFFLVHYPEYLLGIMLFLDINEDKLNKKQVKSCLPIGIIVFVTALSLFFSGLPFSDIISAWATAMATYLVLYYLIVTEATRNGTIIGNILASYGKNSYGIFLLHGFFTWPFIGLTEKIANYFSFSIKNVPGFIIMIPIVLLLCYCLGLVFNKVIRIKHAFDFSR